MGNPIYFNSNFLNFTSNLTTTAQQHGFLYITGLANGFAFNPPYVLKPVTSGGCTPFLAVSKNNGSFTTFTVYGNFSGRVDFDDTPGQVNDMLATGGGGDMFALRITLNGSNSTWAFNNRYPYWSNNNGNARPIAASVSGSLIVLAGYFTNTFNFATTGTSNLSTALANNTSDGFIVSYDYNSLALNKSNRIFGTLNTEQDAHDLSMTSDAGGNVYLADIFYNTTSFAAGNSLTSAGFGDFALVKYTSGVIPIKLNRFTGTLLTNEAVALKWHIETQGKINRFVIEHSPDGNLFSVIGEKAFNGNEYQFNHASPSPGKNYYRLKMIDLDGSVTYSEIVRIAVKEENEIIAYPTVTHASTMIGISCKKPTGYSYSVYTPGGGLLQTNRFMINRYGNVAIDLEKYAPGIYFIAIQNQNGISKTFKIIKQ
jgi:hypothetical protein